MTHITYVKLYDLINTYPQQIEIIKEQYLLLLSELTLTNYIETSLFIKNIERINEMGILIVGYISYPTEKEFEFVTSGTIIIEPKIIRDGKNVGHIEDIVVTKTIRGKGISQIILNMLKDIAREKNCYKVTLNCLDELKNVYIKNGFEVKGLQMSLYLI